MSFTSLIKPKEPISSAWKKYDARLKTRYPHQGWIHPVYKIAVISAVEVPDPSIGPEYHLSVSRMGKRCTASQGEFAKKQFGMVDANEDNHSGILRSYWMPVAEDKRGVNCECEKHEAAVVDGDFTWRPLTQQNAERYKK